MAKDSAKLIEIGVASSRSVTDPKVADGMACYVNFLQAKEQTGIERAVMATVFSVDKFSGDAFSRFNQAVASQQTFLRVFASFASPEQMAIYTNKVQGPAVEAVATMRQRAIDRSVEGQFGVAPAAWFDAITAKMDLMKEVEDPLVAAFVQSANTARADAVRAFVVVTSINTTILLLTIGLGYWIL